ncbi:hypothetical protein AB0I72_22685 [Nocardiopsis sp. NPDC049922]|uniref:hypothetical protein n=1 Tax=Nocardiopsis sp. NPDC049922 TaxID=3155157 RepID=UPI0033F96A15
MRQNGPAPHPGGHPPAVSRGAYRLRLMGVLGMFAFLNGMALSNMVLYDSTALGLAFALMNQVFLVLMLAAPPRPRREWADHRQTRTLSLLSVPTTWLVTTGVSFLSAVYADGSWTWERLLTLALVVIALLTSMVLWIWELAVGPSQP